MSKFVVGDVWYNREGQTVTIHKHPQPDCEGCDYPVYGLYDNGHEAYFTSEGNFWMPDEGGQQPVSNFDLVEAVPKQLELPLGETLCLG